MQKRQICESAERSLQRRNGSRRVKAFLTEIFLIRRQKHVFSLPQKSSPRYLYCLCIFLTSAPKNRITALLVLDQFPTSSFCKRGNPFTEKILLKSFNLFPEVSGRYFPCPTLPSAYVEAFEGRHSRKITVEKNFTF